MTIQVTMPQPTSTMSFLLFPALPKRRFVFLVGGIWYFGRCDKTVRAIYARDLMIINTKFQFTIIRVVCPLHVK